MKTNPNKTEYIPARSFNNDCSKQKKKEEYFINNKGTQLRSTCKEGVCPNLALKGVHEDEIRISTSPSMAIKPTASNGYNTAVGKAYSSPMASLVLTDSSQLISDSQHLEISRLSPHPEDQVHGKRFSRLLKWCLIILVGPWEIS
uniref:(California timema) hypothetical protein n=1 Tax=Timema californicum TaxID=61474 RepID=A0A7R9P773_TIMCA|nr:unnamed protein product [Timema californicum]